jgi:hypothetical protein
MRVAVLIALAASPASAWAPTSFGANLRGSTLLWAKVGTIFGTSSGSTEVRLLNLSLCKHIALLSSYSSTRTPNNLFPRSFLSFVDALQDVADMIAEAFGDAAAPPINIDGMPTKSFSGNLAETTS